MICHTLSPHPHVFFFADLLFYYFMYMLCEEITQMGWDCYFLLPHLKTTLYIRIRIYMCGKRNTFIIIFPVITVIMLFLYTFTHLCTLLCFNIQHSFAFSDLPTFILFNTNTQQQQQPKLETFHNIFSIYLTLSFNFHTTTSPITLHTVSFPTFCLLYSIKVGMYKTECQANPTLRLMHSWKVSCVFTFLC